MRNIRDEKSFFEGSVSLPALAAALNRIYKAVERDGLSEEVSRNLEEDFRAVSEHFAITPRGAVLLSHITEHSGLNGSDEDDLAKFVGCSNIEFIGFRDDLSMLEKKGIVYRAASRGRRFFYVVSNEASKAIETGTEYKPLPWDGLSMDEIFTRLRLFFSDYHKDILDGDRLIESILTMLESNPDLPFCRKVTESPLMKMGPTSQRMFFYLCHRYVTFGDRSIPVEKLLSFSDMMEDEQRIRRAIANESTGLQTSELVTFGGDKGFQDPESLALSESVTSSFFEGVQIALKNDKSVKSLLPASSIVEKALFYNPDVEAQMSRLGELLQQDNFRCVQHRLGEMGMRKGFAVLFSGGAGCGKTAGAYELARRSGRDIFVVDMSELKSKWVGDSEKIVKGVFSTYGSLCRSSEKAPILLFNEADAIFAKRIESPEDSVDQMMNAIQNICLDAIENLDGILIATTNLAENFCDEAFARRFIFKVNFTTPEPATRAKIWRSMLPALSEDEASRLGQRYSFSGGNIENIARKAAVGYVLSGTPASYAEITRYCDEETLSGKGSRKIGF